jgi:predicted transcriptional regulator
MQPGSHRDRISEAIRLSSRPLDDDQLANRTGISPRQRVNQICRELERAGMVRRRSGADGKIVNEWLGNEDPKPDSA